MPGITGIVSMYDEEENEKDLFAMVASMAHEPFYVSGTYVNKTMGVYIGWVSLRGSFSDCMPIFNEKKDVVLILTGEHFGNNAIISEMRKAGHVFEISNASYLVHLYEEKGDGFIKDLNGWFSGVIVDLRTKKVSLFNDRYGMERVYYHEGKSEFLFSSEAKSLLKVRPKLRAIDPRSLGEFITCDCVLENRSLYQNVNLLPGGSLWIIKGLETIKKGCYFKAKDWEDQDILDEKRFYETIKETFTRNLSRYFEARQPIAMSLTAGLDTRMIMACRREKQGKMPCYTFGGMDGETYDVRIARDIAHSCNERHYVIRLDRDFLYRYPYYAERTVYITDGCHDVCGAHDLYLNRVARDIAPIRMTGKFGSEVIRNRSMFKGNSLCEDLFSADFIKYVRGSMDRLGEVVKRNKLSFSVFEEIPKHEYGRLAIERSQLTVRSPYMDNELVKLMYQAPEGSRSSNKIQLRIIRESNPELSKYVTNRGTGGNWNYFISKLAELFYYSILKGEYIYLYQFPHYLAKIDYLLQPLHLERIILGRQKFEYYRLWFRKDISDYVKQVLLDNRTKNRPYFNSKFITKMVSDHINGRKNYFMEISKCLTIELIQRLLIEK